MATVLTVVPATGEPDDPNARLVPVLALLAVPRVRRHAGRSREAHPEGDRREEHGCARGRGRPVRDAHGHGAVRDPGHRRRLPDGGLHDVGRSAVREGDRADEGAGRRGRRGDREAGRLDRARDEGGGRDGLDERPLPVREGRRRVQDRRRAADRGASREAQGDDAPGRDGRPAREGDRRRPRLEGARRRRCRPAAASRARRTSRA